MSYEAVLGLGRLVGACLVIMTGTLIGHGLALNIERETSEADALERGLAVLSAEVSFSLTPLPSALRAAGRAAGGTTGEILTSMGDHAGIIRRATPEEAFLKAVASAKGGLPPREILDTLRDLSKNLGFFGHKEQVRHIEISIDRVRRYREAHQEEARKKARLYRYLGALSALCLVIVLA